MVVQKKCQHCGNNYTFERSTSKFCGAACRRDNSRISSTPKHKRKVQQLDQCSGSTEGECLESKTIRHNPTRIGVYRCLGCRAKNSLHNHQKRFFQSTIGLGIIDLIIRAGTIETFRNIADLNSYVELVRRRRAYESSNKQTDFHICHLSPLKGSKTVGLTNENNCIIGLAKLNQKLGNKEVFETGIDGLHYISQDSLQDKWKIGPKNKNRVRALLVEYFGEELSVWAKDVKFSPRVTSNYKFPTRRRERIFPIMFKQLFGVAAKTLDGDERNNISLAWLGFQYQYLTAFDEDLKDEDFSRSDKLEAAGVAMQKYLLIGESEYAEKVVSELEKLTESNP